MTALLIEGDVRHATLLRNLLADEGLEVEHLRDGLQAKRRLRSGPRPTLLVTGLSVPGADGFAVLRALRAVATPDQTPAIVVSSFLELRTKATGLRKDLGITAVLPRDVSAITLQRVLRRTLKPGLSQPELTPPPFAQADEKTRQQQEARRLATIADLNLDAAPDELLQTLVRDTARAFDMPTALVSLMLEDREWVKAHTGLSNRLADEFGTGRNWSFCSHVVEAGAPLVVHDAATHPAFQSNPLVRDGSVRSYVGAPLITAQGVVLGTLGLIDTRPREIPPETVDALSVLARRVAGELELRAARRRATAQQERLGTLEKEASAAQAGAALARVLGHVVDALPDALLVYDPTRRIVFANWAAEQLFETPSQGLVGLQRDEFIALQAPRFDDPEVFLAALAVFPDGPWSGSLEFEMQRPAPITLRWTSRPVLVGDAAFQLTTFVRLLQPVDDLNG